MAAASEPIAVNTGPLIALSACGGLQLLRSLHTPVVVAEAVMTEFLRGGKWNAQRAVAGIDVALQAAPAPALVIEHLDGGEAATIALAIQRSIPLIAIDERRGRMVARALGLRVTGSVGILLRARREGLIPAIKPYLEAMRAGGVWLGARLCTEVLREAGEE